MTTELMGFRVEWTGDDRAPAVFHGKRGATYGAVRVADESKDWCFLVNLGRFGKLCSIRGNGWVEIPRGSNEIRRVQ